MEIEKINNTELSVKVYQGQRVVTFKDIDTVHERPEGTARKRFNDNKKHFIECEDFYTLDQPSEIRTLGIERPQGGTPDKVLLITESGYLMLVKSFTDDLAWDVQRQLVKSYFRKEHNVKQLTIDSREIAKIIGKMHCSVVKEIECCTLTMQGMGFIDEEFFQKASYIGANSQWNTMYKCTERGCEWFSRQLEPDKRKLFLEEITDRFERMRNVLEGKPVKKMPKLICLADVEEKDPLIRLFKTDAGGIVLINDEVHSLTQDEIEQLSRFVPELEKYEIGKTQYIVSAFLKSMKKSGKLEEIASWGVKGKEKPKALLPDNAVHKPKRTNCKDDNAPFITKAQAMNRYNLSNDIVVRLAKESGAWIKYGKTVRIDTRKMDEHLRKEYAE